MRSISFLTAVLTTALLVPLVPPSSAQASTPTWQTDVGSDTIGYNLSGGGRIESTLDAAGNLFLAGSGSTVPFNTPDFVWVEKLAPDGTSLWYTEWYNPNGQASVAGLVTDPAGNVYIQTIADSAVWRQNCCDSEGQPFMVNIREQVVLRLAANNGAIAWTRAFAKPTTWGLSPHHMTMDSLGRLVTSGIFSESNIPTRHYRHVLTTAGQTVWSAVENEAFFRGPCAPAAQGAVVCVNSGSSFSTYNRDIKVIRYASNGKVQWSRKIDDLGVTNIAADVLVDANDHAVVIGFNAPNNGPQELIRMRLRNQKGQTLWFQRTPLTNPIVNSGTDSPRKNLRLLTTSDGGFIAVGTETSNAAPYHQNLLVRFDGGTGNLEWVTRHEGWVNARASTNSGDPILATRANSTDTLRRIDRATGAIVSDIPLSLGFIESIAVHPQTTRTYAMGVQLDTVTRIFLGQCAAFD